MQEFKFYLEDAEVKAVIGYQEAGQNSRAEAASAHLKLPFFIAKADDKGDAPRPA